MHGPIGIGSSRLIDQLAIELRRRSIDHEWFVGSCNRVSEIAFEPIVGVLRDLPGGAAEWLTESSSVTGEVSGTVETALLAGLAHRIRTAATDKLVVVAIHHIDAADPSTARLLSGLVALTRDAPVLVLLTARVVGEMPPAMMSCAETLIELGPLLAADSAELATALSGPIDGTDDPAVAGDGHPGVMVAMAASGGPLGGLSMLLRSIGPDAADAVAMCDLGSGLLTVDEIVASATCQRKTVEQLIQIGALIADRRRLRATPIWADAARHQTVDRLSELADIVSRCVADTAAPSLRARLAQSAGHTEQASAMWELAAHQALASGAVTTAAAELRRAVALGGDDALRRLGRLAAEWSLAAGDRTEAHRLADELLAVVSRSDSETIVALMVLQHRALFELGDQAADGALDGALDVADTSAARVDALVLDATRLVTHDVDSAGRRAAQAVTAARHLADPQSIASALGVRALVEAFEGDIEASLATFDEAIALAAAADADAAEARLASNRVYVLWRAGRPIEVERAARLELSRLRRRGLDVLGDQLAFVRAVALVQLGRLAEVDEAIELTRQINMSADTRALTDLLAVEVALLRGVADDAVATIERIANSEMSNDPAVACELALRRYEVAVASGDLATAVAVAAAGQTAVGGADLVAQARLTLAHARAACRIGTVIPAGTLEHSAGGELTAIAAELRAIESGHDDGFVEAISAWEAIPAPVEAWRCRLGRAVGQQDLVALAELMKRADELGAIGLVKQADSAWRDAGGKRSGRRTGALLSERELDVLHLVDQGMTNKRIAEQLFISVRTVGAHLEHCCAKLAVSTRGAAVHEAKRRGLLT